MVSFTLVMHALWSQMYRFRPSQLSLSVGFYLSGWENIFRWSTLIVLSADSGEDSSIFSDCLNLRLSLTVLPVRIFKEEFICLASLCLIVHLRRLYCTTLKISAKTKNPDLVGWRIDNLKSTEFSWISLGFGFAQVNEVRASRPRHICARALAIAPSEWLNCTIRDHSVRARHRHS